MDRENNAVTELFCGRYVADFSDGGKVISGDDRFSRISGYTSSDIESGNVNFYNFIPDDERDEYLEKVEEIRKSSGIGLLEHRFVCKSGEVIHIICLGDTFTAENGHTCSNITICDFTDNINLLKKYRHSQKELDALMENVPGGVALYELDNGIVRIVEANEEYYRILGYDDSSKHPGTIGHLLRSGEFSDFLAVAEDCAKRRSTLVYETRFTKVDGKQSWISINGKYFGTNEKGNPLIYGVLFDTSYRKKAEMEIENQTERFKIIAENTDEIYWEYNVIEDSLFLANCINRYDEEDNIVNGYLSEEKSKQFVHPKDYSTFKQKWEEICKQPQRGSIEFRTMAYDDDYRWYKAPFVSVANEQGEVTNVYGRLFSIEHLKKMKSKIDKDKAEIERLSTTDSVTNLFNRKAFKEKVAAYLADCIDKSCCYGIIYSDINDFSYVNDNFGFEAGNQMLYDFAEIIRNSDTNIYACRIYSDYFIGFYKARSRDELVESLKNRNDLFTEMQKKKYPASDIHISSGLYFITDKEIDVTIAMDNANLARRSVKGSKDVPCGIYSDRMRKQRSHDQAIVSELQSAIQNKSIELFLQPKFKLDTREIIGAEALSRWKNPDGTYKMPYEFISVLERVGYIVDLDFYIYEQVLKTMARWKNEGKKLLPISINFSRQHNNYTNFVDRVSELADDYDIEKSLIEIEVTESCFNQDVNTLFSNMRKLREKGFKIDIDDFGIGYSSLSVLLNAPVDIVKVDKVFIDNISTSIKAREYVNQICSLIDSTNKEIIFEGVETERQAEILIADGEHRKAQGWLFDKAITVDEFEKKYL